MWSRTNAADRADRRGKMDWVEKLAREKQDDEAELRRKEKSRPRAERIAERISDYLDGKLSAGEMQELYQKHGHDIERERLRRDAQAAQKHFRASRSEEH